MYSHLQQTLSLRSQRRVTASDLNLASVRVRRRCTARRTGLSRTASNYTVRLILYLPYCRPCESWHYLPYTVLAIILRNKERCRTRLYIWIVLHPQIFDWPLQTVSFLTLSYSLFHTYLYPYLYIYLDNNSGTIVGKLCKVMVTIKIALFWRSE